MSVHRWLEERRDGVEQGADAIGGFVDGVLDGTITRAQQAAWLAFVYTRGMSDAETVHLTRAMTDSGVKLSWPGLDGPFVDKHSTGGVGDKVSLVLAPMWAAMGFRVPMISGRGLGITGGTLDKLEAIPGYRTDLDDDELRTVLRDAGCFISGQTGELAPADKVLYALRNETCTVPSIPLITASILSKKLAEGISRLVLDVKCGSGAFMKNRADAEALADSLVRVGNGAGVATSAHITDMSQPLGVAVGNALEVQEAVDTLAGGGPPAFRELVLMLSGDRDAGARALDSGAAMEHWERMVRGQGGDPSATLSGGGCQREDVLAERAGVVTACSALDVGQAAFVLGAGRVKASDPVHHGVGVLVHAHRGDRVEAGQPLATMVYDQRGVDEARAALRSAFVVTE